VSLFVECNLSQFPNHLARISAPDFYTQAKVHEETAAHEAAFNEIEEGFRCAGTGVSRWQPLAKTTRCMLGGFQGV
jgi:hypothetical protein